MIFWWLRWTLNCNQPNFCCRPIKFEIEKDWHLHRGCLFFYELSTVRIWYLSCCRFYIPLFSTIIFSHFGLRCTPTRIVFVSIQFLVFGKDKMDTYESWNWVKSSALSSLLGSFIWTWILFYPAYENLAHLLSSDLLEYEPFKHNVLSIYHITYVCHRYLCHQHVMNFGRQWCN